MAKGGILLRETRGQHWSLPLAQLQLRQRGPLEPEQVLALNQSTRTRLLAQHDAQRRALSGIRCELTKQSQRRQAQPRVRSGAQPWCCMQRGAVTSGHLQ